MDKRMIATFFNRLAQNWDADMVRNEDRIARILDFAQIGEDQTVLDVACGTGVLIPDYLAGRVRSVTGIDIAQKMIRIARAKFTDTRVSFVCADVEEAEFLTPFDRIVVYNAFPHFPNPTHLIACLTGLLTPGGRLTIAHGMKPRRD